MEWLIMADLRLTPRGLYSSASGRAEGRSLPTQCEAIETTN
jgi:hypothetical protein